MSHEDYLLVWDLSYIYILSINTNEVSIVMIFISFVHYSMFYKLE